MIYEIEGQSRIRFQKTLPEEKGKRLKLVQSMESSRNSSKPLKRRRDEEEAIPESHDSDQSLSLDVFCR